MQFDNGKLQDLMREHNVSHTQLAEVIRRSKSAVSEITSGKRNPSIKSWYRIAVFFDRSFDYFIKRENDTD